MSNAQYSQVPIRAQLSIVSNPPVAPVDINTNLQPQFWRAQGVEIDVAIFDVNDVAVDLSNLVSLTATLLPSPNSSAISSQVVVLAADIVPMVDIAGWENGTEQQAKFVFTAAQTDVGLGGTQSQDYWLVIQGLTTGGQVITYGAGSVTVFNPGAGIPAAVSGIVSQEDADVSAGSTVTLTPGSQVDLQVLTVTGASGTSPIILGTIGIRRGARLTVLAMLPGPSGIELDFYSGIISGPLFYTYTTNSNPTARIDFYFDGSQWQLLSVIQPAY